MKMFEDIFMILYSIDVILKESQFLELYQHSEQIGVRIWKYIYDFKNYYNEFIDFIVFFKKIINKNIYLFK